MRKAHLHRLACVFFIITLLLTSCVTDLIFRQEKAEETHKPIQTEATDISQRPQTDVPADSPAAVHTPSPDPVPASRGSTRINIRAVGDILMHMPLVEAAQQADGSYDFTHMFEDIRPYLKGADIAAANLETTISNKEKGYGGYPMFRTPEELLPALKYAGFNLLTTANNHTLDGREFGVEYTLDKLDEYDFYHTGSARSQEERDQVLIMDINDIKAGILAYTYGTNGMEVTIPEEKLPYVVNYIDQEKIEQDIKRAREAGAEVLIVCIHWGDEYVRQPNDFQIETAEFLVSHGVDIILGCHPHVLQPMERRKVVLDDGLEKEVFIIYSLGNFISNQRDRYRDSGVIVDIEIIKDYDKGTIELGEISYTPTWVYVFEKNGRRDYRVLPVGRFMEEDKGDINASALKRVQEVWAETTDHLGEEGFKINK